MTAGLTSAFRDASPLAQYRDCAEITREVKPLDPLYLFCAGQLAGRAGEFLAGFPGRVSYAVKANSEARVLTTLHGAGLRDFDVASLAETARVAEHCPGATLHFNNPVKPEAAVHEAYWRYGVRSFALDEMAELEKIWRCTGGDRNMTYSVRFKLDHASAAYDFGSKFGADECSASALLAEVRRRGARPALTFHPGSQCTDPKVYGRYIEAAAAISRQAGVALDQLNVGGGFAQPYRNTPVPALANYFDAIRASVAREFDDAVALICEPGRAMVAASATLLTRVVHVRADGQSLFLNDGVYGGLQEQTIVDLDFPVRVWRDGQLLSGAVSSYWVFGPTCDPVDRMSRPLWLPRDIRDGDYVEFGLLGAYGSATATRFNGFDSNCYVGVKKGWKI